MPDLRALTTARNPIVFPPPEICNYDPNLDEMETWLSQLKEYMRTTTTAYDGNESGIVTRSISFESILIPVTRKLILVQQVHEG
jgi:hypothetical protein